MPTFVVLEHDHPELHWDFMLEHGGVLKTWRLPASWPAAGQKLPAVALADHRLQYLDYEGPVSGDRGRVVRRDRGSYELLNRRAEPRERSELTHSDPLRGSARQAELTHSDPLRGSARQDEDPFQDGQVWPVAKRQRTLRDIRSGTAGGKLLATGAPGVRRGDLTIFLC